MMKRITPIILSLITLASHAHAQSREWCYIITDELKITPLYFERVDSDVGILASDRDGQQHTIEHGTYFSLSFDPSRWTQTSGREPEFRGTVFIGLTDGQRIRAAVKHTDDPETLLVERADGIQARIPIDRISFIASSLDPSDGPKSNNEDDALELTNGDTLTGFILEIGPSFTIETSTGILTIPIDRISRATIQNPLVHTPGTYIHTTQGERLRVDSFASDDKHTLTLSPSDLMYTQQPTPEIVVDHGLLAVEHKREDAYISNPTLAGPSSVSPTGDRAWTLPPITEIGSWIGDQRTTIEIPAPTAVRWTIPDGAVRFSAAINADYRPWTDLQAQLLAITADGNKHTLWSMRMKPETPMIDILVDLPGDTTAIELRTDPGEFGPIQDRVWFRTPLLLIEGSPQFQ
jgi:hypothetical protein